MFPLTTESFRSCDQCPVTVLRGMHNIRSARVNRPAIGRAPIRFRFGQTKCYIIKVITVNLDVSGTRSPFDRDCWLADPCSRPPILTYCFYRSFNHPCSSPPCVGANPGGREVQLFVVSRPGPSYLMLRALIGAMIDSLRL